MKYTEDHEWLRIEPDGNSVTVGITDFAQSQLGDVVYVALPPVGKTLSKGDEAVVIESVKSAGEVLAAVAGTVNDVNSVLADDPGLINSDPVGDGWIFKMTLDDSSSLEALMDEDGYTQYLEAHN
jgi:glycine cleavage system H protein